MKTFKKQIQKLLKNSFVKKWFISLFVFIMLLFTFFISYTYISSKRILKSEITSYSVLQSNNVAAYLEDSFFSYNQVVTLLALNENVNVYLFSNHSTALIDELHPQIYNQLQSYKQALHAIDSIYLYPSSGKEVFLSSNIRPISLSLEDEETEDARLLATIVPDEKSFMAREKNNRYPYLITITSPLKISGKQAMIALNIDMSKIAVLQNNTNDFTQSVYIVSDQGEILYRNMQENMPESLDIAEPLKHFDNNIDFYSEYITENVPYVYVQQHSRAFPWYYITVTHTQNYMNNTYNLFDSLGSFLPWILVPALVIIVWLVMWMTHPIRTISEFLESPFEKVPDNISEPETEKLIREFINYFQNNQLLSKELEQQVIQRKKATFLALQSQINPHFLFNTLSLIRNIEIETLGYDHEAPNMTLTLSKLLRYAFHSTELVPLSTEFYYTSLYSDILNKRYRGKLNLTIQQDSSATDVLLPKLIIQPLIENAIFHGCSPQLQDCNQILLSAKVKDGICFINVKDNGQGIPTWKLEELQEKIADVKNLPEDSIGLQNVATRMFLTYGDEFQFTIKSTTTEQSEEHGTCITLSFPVK